MAPTSSGETLQDILGHKIVIGIYRDERSEPIKVRELTLAEIPAYAAVLDDEAKAAELFCGREPGWAESLTRSSLEEIVAAGEELNLPFTVGWMQRRAERQLKVAKALGADVSSLVDRAMQMVSQSAAGLPTSPSQSAAPQPNSQR